MQTDRLFTIIYKLLQGKTTYKELAQILEVSERTVVRDLIKLELAGVPIYTTRGRYGGVSLMENFKLPNTLLTKDEQKQLLLALNSLEFIPTSSKNILINKLESTFQEKSSEWISIDFSSWNNPEHDEQKFNTIYTAISRELSLNITYYDNHNCSSSREILPIKLIFKNKNWYLHSYCLSKQAYRLFKVAQIKRCLLTDKHFKRSEYNTTPDNYVETNKLVNLKLQFNACVATRLYEEFEPTKIKALPNDSYFVTVNWPEDSWLYNFLLSFGPNVTIIEPEYVKHNLLALLEEIKANYL